MDAGGLYGQHGLLKYGSRSMTSKKSGIIFIFSINGLINHIKTVIFSL